MFKIVLDEVPPPQSIVPDLDPAFASIVSRAMARDVNQRFQSTAEVIQALEAWSQSGQSVALPTATQASAAGHLPSGARGSMASISDAGAPVVGQMTAGTWATSQPNAAPLAPKKSAVPAIAAALGMGMLLLGGGAYAAYALHNKAPAAAGTSAPAMHSAPLPLGATPPDAVPPAAVPPAVETTTPAESAAPAQSASQAAPPRPAVHSAVRRAMPAARPAAKPARAPLAKPGTPDFGY
jgi:hypothetical protein